MAWESIPIKEKPHKRAYLQAAIVGGNLYIFGGYDGSKCLRDFRRICLFPNLFKIITSRPVQEQVRFVMNNFAKKSKSGLVEEELVQLFSDLSVSVVSATQALIQSSAAGNVGAALALAGGTSGAAAAAAAPTQV